MKSLAVLAFCGVSCASTLVTGSAFLNLDWAGDGGITLGLGGIDVSAGGAGTPLEMGDLISCTSECYLGFYSAGYTGQVSGAAASIGGMSSNHFLLSLYGDDTHMAGTLTLYDPMTISDPSPINTVMASEAIESFVTASPVQQSNYYRERTFDFSDFAEQGADDPMPEPSSFLLVITALLMYRRRAC